MSNAILTPKEIARWYFIGRVKKYRPHIETPTRPALAILRLHFCVREKCAHRDVVCYASIPYEEHVHHGNGSWHAAEDFPVRDDALVDFGQNITVCVHWFAV